MADFTFNIPSKIILSSFAAFNIGTYARETGKRFVLIVDPFIKSGTLFPKIADSLNACNINYFVFDEIEYKSDSKTLESVLTLSRNAHIDAVLAVGGSKVLNLARAVSSLYNETDYLYNFIEGQTPKSVPLPLLCLPTTMRDSFIFSKVTPIVDSRNQRLKILNCQDTLCKTAVFDPTLNRSLSSNQITAMSLESLCLACETYLSQKSSFFSDMMSCKAIELISLSLEDNKENSTGSRDELLEQGGCIASLAAGTSSIGAATLLSLCINTRYEISSYLVCSILFPYMIEDAAKFKKDKISKITRIMGLYNQNKSEEECIQDLMDYLRQKLASNRLPTRLKELNLSLSQLSAVAEEAAELDLANKLPRSMSAEDLYDLIKKAY